MRSRSLRRRQCTGVAATEAARVGLVATAGAAAVAEAMEMAASLEGVAMALAVPAVEGTVLDSPDSGLSAAAGTVAVVMGTAAMAVAATAVAEVAVA